MGTCKGKKNNQTIIHQFIFFDLRILIAHFMLEDVDIRSVFDIPFFSLLFNFSYLLFYFFDTNLFSTVLRGSLYFIISFSCILSLSSWLNSLYLFFMSWRWSNLFFSKLFTYSSFINSSSKYSIYDSSNTKSLYPSFFWNYSGLKYPYVYAVNIVFFSP